jgi:GT2 family glycosyltransferase
MIDNASTDNSIAYVKEKFKEVRIIELDKNFGFAKGNNLGVNYAKGEYLFFLNQDTVVDKNCLNELVQSMTSDPKIGMCGGKMMYWNEKKIINSTGLIANNIFFTWDRGSFELDLGQYDKDLEVISVSGAAMLIKKDLFSYLAGFDSKYFMYYEDFDLGVRTWLSGYKVIFVPKAIVYHKMVYSHKNYYHFEYIDHRNRLRTILKNISRQHLIKIIFRSLYYDLKCIMSWFKLREFEFIKYRLRALLWNLKMLPNTLQKRRAIQKQRMFGDNRLLKMIAPGNEAPVLHVPVPSYVIKYKDTIIPEEIRPILIMGDRDEEQLGFGWYSVEFWDGKHIRWTTNYAIAFLKRDLRQEKTVSNIVEIEMFSPLKTVGEVYLNEKRAGEFKISRPEWKLLSFKILDHEEIQKVTIKTPGFKPIQITQQSNDRRLLGVAVSSMIIKTSD